jgi:bifunctional DNA-binding transcriptional regulator/antitoxin component of YhaV-PrlF toxin-antitoxin module
MNGKDAKNGSFLSPQDRKGLGDGEGKPVYVAVRDKDGHIQVDRYRPSDKVELRQQHTDNATERMDSTQVEKIAKEMMQQDGRRIQESDNVWRKLGN